MMLEYAFFKQFGQDVPASTLADFLLKSDEFQSEEFHLLANHAALEIAKGLAYLHSKEIAHGDLKPTNILISNQHYALLSDDKEIMQQYNSRPIACKLADFGESQSLLIQRQSFLASGEVMFMTVCHFEAGGGNIHPPLSNAPFFLINKLTSVFHASVLLLIMNFLITLSK